MAATKSKPNKRPADAHVARTEFSVNSGGVLTFTEAANYLRVAKAEILRLAHFEDLPGRQIGAEWRFLKEALQDWLRTPSRNPGKRRSWLSREAGKTTRTSTRSCASPCGVAAGRLIPGLTAENWA